MEERKTEIQVFISWSGDLSRQIARILVEWLPLVVDRLKPWMSDRDITYGANFFSQIHKAIELADHAIICVTPENVGKAWLNYEVGALTLRMNSKKPFADFERLCCPFLFGLKASELNGPLTQFRCFEYENDKKEAIKKLLENLTSRNLTSEEETNLDNQWESLQQRMAAVDFLCLPSVQYLHAAESHMLQVLTRDFEISRRNEDGLFVKVWFDAKTPAIWNRQGIQNFCKASEAKVSRKGTTDKIDDHLSKLLDGETHETFVAKLYDIRFRFASGGTLPILNYRGRDSRRYYCLIYREVEPIGWNIANGGCNSRDELFDPHGAIRRELAEELILFNKQKRERYKFYDETDIPDKALIGKAIQSIQPGIDFMQMTEKILRPRFIQGPDALHVEFVVGSNRTNEIKETKGYFTNINLEDFGIEFDQVAEITVDEDTVIMDGEFTESTRSGIRIVNAPVGLFEVDQTNRQIKSRATQFIPDILFWNGDEIKDRNRIETILKHDFIETAQEFIDPREYDKFKTKAESNRHLNLCPVTSTIVKRCKGDGLRLQEYRARLAQSKSISQRDLDQVITELAPYKDTLRPNDKSERLRLFDSSGQNIGTNAPRWLCHLLGLRHRCAHVLLIWNSPAIGDVLMLQLRDWNKDDSPGCIDISVGGHMTDEESGTENRRTASEEMLQEIGLGATDLESSLKHIGGYAFDDTKPQYNFYNYEWRDLYLGRIKQDRLGRVRFTDGEVAAVLLLPIKGAQQLLKQSLVPMASALENSLPNFLEYILSKS